MDGPVTFTRILVVAWAYTVLMLPRAHAQSAPEYEVKAAFLLNFTKFVEWPPGSFPAADSPLTICIVGKDPFLKFLDDMVADESVNGHRLTVRRLSADAATQGCRVLFAGVGEQDVARILGSAGRGVLTVGEGDRFMRAGGMITFVIQNQRVRFDVNLSAAQAAGLRLSARLLTVARSVVK